MCCDRSWPSSTSAISTTCQSLPGRNTTTEFLAQVIFKRLVAAGKRGDLGPGGSAVEQIRVTLHESHVASASFEDRTDAAT